MVSDVEYPGNTSQVNLRTMISRASCLRADSQLAFPAFWSGDSPFMVTLYYFTHYTIGENTFTFLWEFFV